VTKPVLLVIGATGLIGDALTVALQETRHLHCVSRRPGTQDDVEWHAIDVASDKGRRGCLRAPTPWSISRNLNFFALFRSTARTSFTQMSGRY
jgi:hypothetical protein